MEYDFTVHYRKGLKNQIADAISRLPTFGETKVAPDTEIPCYIVEGYDAQPAYSDSFQREEFDYEPEDDSSSEDDDLILAATEEPEVDTRVLTMEEIVREQATDGYCIRTRTRMRSSEAHPFAENTRGVLVRLAKIDQTEQIVLPKVLRERALYLAHYPVMAGHPGGTRMCHNLRRQVYWPSMAMDVYNTVRNCVPCARERVKLRRHASHMKLFPATAPLEFNGIDLLGPF